MVGLSLLSLVGLARLERRKTWARSILRVGSLCYCREILGVLSLKRLKTSLGGE